MSYLDRQHYKYIQYQKMVGGLKNKIVKTMDHIPLKSVFRSFNPEEMHHEMLAKRLEGIDIFQNTNAQVV